MFNQVALEIKDLSQAIAMYFILFGLKLGDFYKSLTKWPVETMIKLLARLAKFINMKEVEAIKRQVDWPNQ